MDCADGRFVHNMYFVATLTRIEHRSNINYCDNEVKWKKREGAREVMTFETLDSHIQRP